MIWCNTHNTQWSPQAGMQRKGKTRSLLQREELSTHRLLNSNGASISMIPHKLESLFLNTFWNKSSSLFPCAIFTLPFLLILQQTKFLLSRSHLHCLYLLVAAIPGDEPAVFSSRQQRAIPQHAQGKDAALVSSLDDVADAISACVTEMGWDGWGGWVGQAEGSTAWRGQINRQGDR